jgi:hypothetical protein
MNVIIWAKQWSSWNPTVCRSSRELAEAIMSLNNSGTVYIVTQVVTVDFSAELKPSQEIPPVLIPDMVVEKLGAKTE